MIDEAIRQKIQDIAKKRKLELVVFFGSQATGKNNSQSDIDIAALPKDPKVFSQTTEEIGSVFGRNDIEVSDLSVPSPFLWHEVAKNGAVLFESRKGLFSEWKIHAMNLWFDTAPLRAIQKQALQSWALKQQT